ncbi:hypothetical protein NQ317_013317 [Molorchus minor]|uniref:Protein HIRA-like C-terminal domain-containing protein n=1 Tax=Molorchus minor TaxID=1323400 RepID=A0ABQ9J3F1_9CUCU|nr:hypothetical protein NQ317_013317 [Molorchus minor]
MYIIIDRVQLSNPLDPVSRTGGSLTRQLSPNLPLASLQRSMPVHRSVDTLPPGVTLSFLESQITATSVLESPAEYRHWLFATVNHLLNKANNILKILFQGLSKRMLLKEVLGIIKTKLPWQRLYKEYSENFPWKIYELTYYSTNT